MSERQYTMEDANLIGAVAAIRGFTSTDNKLLDKQSLMYFQRMQEHYIPVLEKAVDGVLLRNDVDVERIKDLMSEAQLNDMASMIENVRVMSQFIRWAISQSSFMGGDLDGGSVQDKAESLGLLRREKCTKENFEQWIDSDWLEEGSDMLVFNGPLAEVKS